MRRLNLDRVSFALGLVALSVLGLVYGDFALQWQPVPAWVPARGFLAYVSAGILLTTGIGLLSTRLALPAARVLFFYLSLWLVALKLPKVIMAPLVEVNWLGAGEIAVLVAAGWVLFATLREGSPGLATDERGMRIARVLFAVALLPIGLAHFVYGPQTMGFVPAWLPWRAFWAYLGGAGHIAAGLGVLLGVYPRLAATLEAAMIGVFTILVWGPGVVAAPTNRLQWTGFIISWVIGAAAWVVAGSLPRREVTVVDGAQRDVAARGGLGSARAREGVGSTP